MSTKHKSGKARLIFVMLFFLALGMWGEFQFGIVHPVATFFQNLSK